MEPVSLGVGIVGLAALFNSVVEVCNQVSAYRHADLDLHFVATRLENLKHILNEWADKVGIDDRTILENHNDALDDSRTRQRVEETLKVIQRFIERINHILLKKSKGSSKKVRSTTTSLEVPEDSSPVRPPSPLRKALWAIVDKDNVLPNIEQLDALVNELLILVPVDHYTNGDVNSNGESPKASQDDISGFTESRTPSDEDPGVAIQKREEVKIWLNACSTEATYEALRDCRTKETCQWVIECPTYRKWLETNDDSSQSRTLWLHAAPGFGKSVLSAFLIEHHTSVGATLYFFCSGSEEATRRPISILRSCVMQATKYREALAVAYDHKCKSDNIHASEPDLWRLFQDLLHLKMPFTVVVDGFDECSDFETHAARKSLFGRSSFLKRFHQSFFTSQSRLLIVSRFVPDIASALGHEHDAVSGSNAAYGHQILVEDVAADVEHFATNLVRDQLPQATTLQQDDTGRQLAKKSEGAFLWVLLQKPLLTPVDTIERVQQQISLAPMELSDVYNSDWQRIQALPEVDKNRALLLLRWVTLATRPLGLLELFDAIKIEEIEQGVRGDAHSYRTEEVNPIGDQGLRSELIRLAGTFASIRQAAKGSEAATNVMEITHITAKWFLFRMLKNKTPLGASPVKDNTLATLCLRYLNKNATWNQSDSKDPRISSNPFRLYATMNWPVHADPLRDGGHEFEELAQTFFSPENEHWVKWRQLYEAEHRKALPFYFPTNLRKSPSIMSHEPGSLTYYASHFGLNRILRRMDGNNSLDLNTLGGLYGTPLQAACVESHLPTVLWLLRYGAQHTLPDNVVGSALHTAVYSGNILLVAALLRKGANPNQTDAVNRRPLHIAALHGHVEVVRRLVVASESVNSQEGNGWYPLITASRFGHQAVVEKLLGAGADTACCTNDGLDAVMAASVRGDCGIIQMLIDAGALTDRLNNGNWTALHYAADAGHVDVVRLLLSHRDEKDDTSGRNSRAIGLAARRGLKTIVEELLKHTCYSLSLFIADGLLAIHMAALEGHADILSLLHSHGADINAEMYNWKNSPLLLACRNGHEKAIERLVSLGAKQYANTLLNTPIQQAARNGSLAAVKLLIDHGADIHFANNVGATPLYIVSGRGYVEVAKLLIEHGANIHTPKKGGWTPLHYAAEQNFPEMVKLLLEHGAEVDRQTDVKATSVYVASGRGNTEVVKILVEHGSNVHIPNKRDWTPLHYAVEKGHLEIVDILIKQGASLDAINSVKWTPSHVAAQYGRLAIYEKLQQAGAAINIADSDGRVPLTLATQNGHTEILTKMVRDGVDVNRRDARGTTILTHAVIAGKVDIVDCLLNAGADPYLTSQGIWGTSLGRATKEGNLDIITKILEKSRPPPHGYNDSYHPLRQAMRAGKPDVVKCLMDVGFNLETTDNAGRTALHSFISQPILDLIRDSPVLLDTVARIDLLGCSILHHIVRNSQPEILKWAVGEVQLDVNKQDNYGWTPLHWATYCKNTPVVKALIDWGADKCRKDIHGRLPRQIAKIVSADAGLLKILEVTGGPVPDDDAEEKHVPLVGACDCCWHELVDVQHHCKTCEHYDLCLRCIHDKDILHPTDHEFVQDFRY